MSDARFELGESFARILTETTQSLVCVLDADGRILLFNEACERATGYTRDEVLGRDARDLVIPPEEREAFGEFLTYVAKTGASMPQVGHWITKDGERRLIAWSNKPMGGTDGTPMQLVTTGIDLTDRSLRDEDERALAGDPEAKLAEVGRLATEQRALRRVATLVASEAQPERVFAAVSDECARVLEVNASTVFRFDADGAATVVGRYIRDNIDVFPIGERVVDPHSSVGRVRESGAPVRIDDWGGISGPTAEAMYQGGYRSTAAAPIVVGGTLWGAVGIASEKPLPPETENRLAAFCELISLALASAQAREDLVASRLRLVRAGDETRRRLERNLHDGAQQRLVSVALTLRLARARLGADEQGAGELLDEAARELDTGLQELREIARGLHPAILSDRGLLQALETLAARVPVPLTIDAPADRLPGHIEATIYYIVAEALTNVARHAEATEARVTIRRDDTMVRCEVSDDGRGGADITGGTGILGLRDRAEAAGGTLTLTSPPGKGTIVAAALPLARGRPDVLALAGSDG
jgi:PAS domain S-box-containing protein